MISKFLDDGIAIWERDMSSKPKNAYYGLPDFSMGVQYKSAEMGIQMSVGMTEFSMGHVSLFKEGFNKIVPDDALLFLTAHWPAISGPYSGASSADTEIDLAAMLVDKHPPIIMRRSGVYIGFDAIRPRIDLGVYSVVVIECLLRLGDIIYSIVENENLKSAWAKAKSLTQVFPMAEERYDRDEDEAAFEVDPLIAFKATSADIEFWQETEWLAKQLGQPVVEYCAIAYWLDARNILAATDQSETAPTSEEWAWDTMEGPKDLPLLDDVIAMLHRAAGVIGNDASSVARDAISNRNSWARQIAVYRKWFGSGRDQRPTHDAGLVTGAFYVELEQFDKETGTGKVKTSYRKGEAILKSIDPQATASLDELVGKMVIVNGTANYKAEQQTPLSINVSRAELDKHGEWSKARLKKFLRN